MNKLTPEEKNIRIAKANGYKWFLLRPGRMRWMSKEGRSGTYECEETDLELPVFCSSAPDYFTDLNATYEAWEALTEDQKTVFAGHIRRFHEGMDIRVFAAFKTYGAECIGQTLNLWQDGE